MPKMNKQKNNRNKGGGDDMSPKALFRQFGRHILGTLLIFSLILTLYSAYSETNKIEDVTISALAGDIRSDLVKKISVEGDALTIEYKDSTVKYSKKETETSLSQMLLNYGLTAENLKSISVEVKEPSGFMFWMFALLPILGPIIFVLIVIWYISRQVRGSSMQAFSFGQSRARMIDPSDEKQKIKFKDVAGVKEAKEELLEIVDFLKNPKKFIDIGARIPKGVILMGPPGSGKTLLARAVAGEANVPFFFLSGSEFVEMFVGVGASRVRDLFKMAKKVSPSIIFIDEIDAVARHRGAGIGRGNDEREQTLNQILVEMDGFETTEKVIIMAATNRPDVLDQALLRPGRFDRRVVLDMPDMKDREEILKIHGRGKPFAEDVNLKLVAERTPGFSGADLANLMNEASILTARENRLKVSQFDLIRSVEKVMLGPERKSHILSDKEKLIIAYHEMGHALVASVLPEADPVHKVSIISSGHAAGYTLKLPLEEKQLHTKKHFLDDIAVSLGGYAAEKLIFGDMTTGASNDISVATALARNMVTRFGMSDKIGPIDFGDSVKVENGFASNSPCSEKYSAEIDGEVSKIMSEGLKRAEEMLTNYRKALDGMTAELKQVETLEREDFEKLLILNGIKPKKSEVGAVKVSETPIEKTLEIPIVES